MTNFILTFHKDDEIVKLALVERNYPEAKAHAKRCLGEGYTLVTVEEY